MDKEQVEKAAEKAIEVTAKQNWPNWVKHTIAAILGAIAGVLGVMCC